MKNPYKDITGIRFGRLVALEMHAEKYKKTMWLCQCDCGNKKLIPLDSLSSGKGISCGCFRKEATSEKFKKHYLRDKRLYRTWTNMRSRCNNPKTKSFKNYGGRGISVCKEWDDFKNFYNWAMENGYTDDLTIDRIDVNGNYEPSNCRWLTREDQMNNTTKNVFTEINNVVRTLAEHAKTYGINYFTLHHRYETGLRGEELIKPLKKNPILIEINGEIKTLKDWSVIYNFSYGTVKHRYNNGLRGKDLFKPVDPIRSANANKKKWESA